MTNQETFDTVVHHLRQQGAKARRTAEDGCTIECLYRDRVHNRKCAAGCLIPDADYSDSMESQRCDIGRIADVLRINGHDPDFVRRLQNIHDGISAHYWERAFRNLAEEVGLVYRKP